MPRAALIQLSSGDEPLENLPNTLNLVDEAISSGANFILTPEVTNCVSTSRAQQNRVLCFEEDDPTLAALREKAQAGSVWILIGSLGLKTDDADGRFANRSFLISPDGEIRARYDKIHMFDVDISLTETFRESDGYRPGDKAVVAQTNLGKIGMAICYDVRFPHLFRTLANHGAKILTVPAAFSPVSGAAHWESLLRARAIENGCYVFAPAQCGDHPISTEKPRKTWGHSLAISPWGEVLVDGGDEVGINWVDFDLAQVDAARRKIPSLLHERPFKNPDE